jgi:uroporphyrin-3 C-methyltransferase
MSGHASGLSKFMTKRKPSSNKDIVKADAPEEKAASQNDEATANNQPGENNPPAEGTGPEPVEPASKDENRDPETVVPKSTETEIEKKSSPARSGTDSKPAKSAKATRGFPYFGVFNLLLIIGIVAAAGYYWQMQQKLEQQKNITIANLQQQLANKANKADNAQLQQRLAPLESGIGQSESQISELQSQQQALLESTEMLYDLYGRDESGWQLAEVEYLMRVAQHKLILENDFEGAAITLQAASDKIAATADPGLLPVRVQISDEIAILKTRARPDLVGMTLLLSQLGKQLHALKPGYQPQLDTTTGVAEPKATASSDQAIDERVMSFISSLVTIKQNDSLPPTQTEALILDVEEILETNLKLTRWTVLERDEFQFSQLMKQNVRLFKQYYDLENAANNDFYAQLLQLQKASVKPQKPDISQSLEMLKHIMSRREQAPVDAGEQESGDV